ncbi:MAG: hypothetical protein WEC33_06725 [Dehalococcoidia bacterium]
MKAIRKHILTDEANQPVAVQIDYQDWLEIERALNITNGTPRQDPNRYAGVLKLSMDPLEYQNRERDQW